VFKNLYKLIIYVKSQRFWPSDDSTRRRDDKKKKRVQRNKIK
jgi:hypothetical protein